MPEFITFKQFKIYIGFRNIDVSNWFFPYFSTIKEKTLTSSPEVGEVIEIKILFCSKIPPYSSISLLT